MNDTIPLNLTRPDVAAFVAAVRARLADLPPEEQQELTDGLEADLTDLVAERGEGALGDPQAYARELRTAAGLDPVMGRVPGGGQPVGERVTRLLDASHARWERAVSGLPGSPWEFLVSLRPAWWVLRAWVAAELVNLVLGVSWLVVLLPAVVGSVQVGRGLIWPGSAAKRSTAPRVVLLVLNVFALLVAPVALAQGIGSSSGPFEQASSYPVDPGVGGPGMTVDGSFVENIYPYDAQGHALTGVQLYDQNGKPLDVTRDPGYVDATEQFLVRYPWQNGDTRSWNTYPLPERVQDGPGRSAGAFDELNPPAIKPPLAAVSPVSLPGITASTLVQEPQQTTQKSTPKKPAKKRGSGSSTR